MLTYQSVPQLLQQLGYTVAAKKYNDGRTFWDVSAQLDGWNYLCQVTPAELNGKILGLFMTSDLGKKIDTQSASAAGLLKLLEWNTKFGGQDLFGYNADTQTVVMKSRFGHGDANAEDFRIEFQGFFKSIRDTHALWSNTNGNGNVAVNPTPAPAPQPQPQPQPQNTAKPTPAPVVKSVANSTWSGTEQLAGFGKLTFELKADGKAVMIDATATVNGDWSQKGNEVTVTFSNCVYVGRINGQTMSGTGRFTTGEQAGQTWNFQLSLSR